MVSNVTAQMRRAGNSRAGWLIAAGCGLTVALWFPPFNHETSPFLALFPLGAFFWVIPLLFFSLRPSWRHAVGQCAVFGFCASLAQYYWIGFVAAEGLWGLILLGTLLICLIFTLYYVLLSFCFRVLYRYLGRGVLLCFPSVWVLSEWFRTRTELSFPWLFLGNAPTPLLPLAQLASVWGVYGFSFIIVLVNVSLYLLLRERVPSVERRAALRALVVAVLVLIVGSIWGALRLASTPAAAERIRISCIQPNIDQLNWGNHSLEESFAVAESLTYVARFAGAESIVLPESALLCYLERRPALLERVLGWSDSVQVPLILGALHWERDGNDAENSLRVYNTAFRFDTDPPRIERYHKMKLVPFSEAVPFQGLFPLLSRVNLGQADFSAGTKPAIFELNRGGVRGAPLICYEVIYPGFVRKRLQHGADILVNITNDGWFGRTSGPYHHLYMARLRTIENGVSLVRSANSGISAAIDPYGRILGQTGLYTRTLLTVDVPFARVPTLYTLVGNLPVLLVSALFALAGLLLVVVRMTGGGSGRGGGSDGAVR